MNGGDEVKADPALVERVRARLETDGTVIRGTDKAKRHEVLHRAAVLAVEELTVSGHPITWATAKSRPHAAEGVDDPRDVLIGRLAVLLGSADGGHHAASYAAVLSAARRLVTHQGGS